MCVHPCLSLSASQTHPYSAVVCLATTPLSCCCTCNMQAVEKLIVSKLLVEGSNKRIYNVDHHVGMVSSCSGRSG